MGLEDRKKTWSLRAHSGGMIVHGSAYSGGHTASRHLQRVMSAPWQQPGYFALAEVSFDFALSPLALVAVIL